MQHAAPLPPTAFARQLPRDIARDIVVSLHELLPPPAIDTPEAWVSRDHLAVARVSALAPASFEEADFAAQYVACLAHSRDCLRLAARHGADFKDAARLRAQQASMGREARGWHNALTRMQDARRKREMSECTRDRAGPLPEMAAAVEAVALGMAASGMTAPGMTARGMTARGMTARGMAASGMPEPDLPKPEMAAPGVAAPNMPVPEIAAPDQPMPELGVTGMPMPEMAMTDVPMPDMPAPDLAAPDMAVPATASPEIAVTENAVAENAVAEMAVAEMAAPDISEPDVPAPEIAEPELAALITQALATMSPMPPLAPAATPPPPEEVPPRPLAWSDLTEDEQRISLLWQEADRYAMHHTVQVQQIRQLGGLPPDYDYEPPRPEVLDIIIHGDTSTLRWADTYVAWVPPSPMPAF
jgi:hypothetical protein